MTAIGPTVVYLLCLAASSVCAVLLVRAWLRSRTRLLLWAGLCFVLLAANNLFLILDVVVLPGVPLLWARQGTQLAAICVLLYGFIWESEG